MIAVLLPVMILLLYNTIQVNSYNLEDLDVRAQTLANSLSWNLNFFMEQSADKRAKIHHELLGTHQGRLRKSEILKHEFSRYFHSIALLDEEGGIVASYPPASKKISYKDLAWFQRMKEMQDQVQFEFGRDKVSDENALIFASRLPDLPGEPSACLVFFIKISELKKAIAQNTSRNEAKVILTNKANIVIFTYPDILGIAAGQSYTDSVRNQILTSMDRRGELHVTRKFGIGDDGGVVDIHLSGARFMTITQNLLFLNLGGIVFIILFAFLLSRVFGYRFFYLSISRMLYNIRHIRKGDFSVRCQLNTIHLDEIRHLAMAFNIMAENLENRKEEIIRTQAELKEKEEVLRNLINASPDLICLKDGGGRWQQSNQACKNFFGYTEEQVLGKKDEEIAGLNPDYRDIFLQSRESDLLAWRMCKPIRRELFVKDSEGKDRVFDVIKIPLYDSERHRKGIVILGRDISRRKRLEKILHRSKERYKAVINDQVELICRVALDRKINFINQAFSDVFGVDRSQILGKTYTEFLPPKDLEKVNEFVSKLSPDNPSGLIEHRMIKPNGEHIWVQRTVSAITNEEGKIVEYQSVCRDISEQIRTRDELTKLSQAVLNSPASVVITDAEGTIEYVNPRFSEVTGYTIDEVIGKKSAILKSDYHSPEFYQSMWETIKSGKDWRGEFCNRGKDGRIFWELASISSVPDTDGQIRHFIAVKEDITERKNQEETIRHLAQHDQLTGLANRLQFNERIKYEISRAQRVGHKFAILYVDLDGFKPINDDYGHETGDIVLKHVAQRLKSCIRDVDMVSRIGGDEFVVILTDISEKENAARVAEKILQALSDPFQVSPQQLFQVSASIGIAVFPSDGRTREELLKNADQAMYFVKHHGKNNFSFYQDISRGQT